MTTFAQRMIGTSKRQYLALKALKAELNQLADMGKWAKDEWIVKGYDRHVSQTDYHTTRIINLYPSPWDSFIHFNRLLEELDNKIKDTNIIVSDPMLESSTVYVTMRLKDNYNYIYLKYIVNKNVCTIIPTNEIVPYPSTKYIVSCH